MQVGTLEVKPGMKTRGFLETPGYANALKARVPVLIAAGEKPGPTLSVVTGQHGRELNGMEAVRRVFDQLAPATMSGTFLAVPVANPLAVRLRQQDFSDELARYLSTCRNTNMNRVWPGNAEGNVIEQLAYTIWNGIVAQADCAVDLHGWTDLSLGLVWADERERELARVFGYGIYMVSQYAGRHNHNLDTTCYDNGIPRVTAELPPQNVVHEDGICMGVRGLTNLLIHLGIVEGTVEIPEDQVYIMSDHVEYQLQAECEGLLVPVLKKGDMVAEGDLIAQIVSLETMEVAQEVRSPAQGLLYNVGFLRMEALAHSSILFGGETVALVKEVLKA